MNAKEVFTKLKVRCGDTFVGVFAKDRLPAQLPPRRPLLLICNTDTHDRSGEHWIAMYIGHNGEYFDSFAQDVPVTFARYMNKYCSTWKCNEQKLQSVISSFCGHYCVFYCLFKYLGYDMNSILNCFSDDTALNDLLVHNFVCQNL